MYPCVEYELLQLADVRSSQVYPVLRRLVLGAISGGKKKKRVKDTKLARYMPEP